MKNCPNCKIILSDTTDICPSCGFDISQASDYLAPGEAPSITYKIKHMSKTTKIISISAVVLIIFSIIVSFSGTSYSDLMKNYESGINSKNESKIVDQYSEPYAMDSTDMMEVWEDCFYVMDEVYGDDFKVTISNVEYKEKLTNDGSSLTSYNIYSVHKLDEMGINYDECLLITASVNISGYKKSETDNAEIVVVKIDGDWYIYNDQNFITKFIIKYMNQIK